MLFRLVLAYPALKNLTQVTIFLKFIQVIYKIKSGLWWIKLIWSTLVPIHHSLIGKAVHSGLMLITRGQQPRDCTNTLIFIPEKG